MMSHTIQDSINDEIEKMEKLIQIKNVIESYKLEGLTRKM